MRKLFYFSASLLLICSCKKDAKPSANFTFDSSVATVPVNLQFLNTSTNADSFLWDFGDSTTSTEISPVHSYLNGGTYGVSLIAYGNGNESKISKSVALTDPAAKIIGTYNCEMVVSYSPNIIAGQLTIKKSDI